MVIGGMEYLDGSGELAEIAKVHGAAAVEGYESELFGGGEEVGWAVIVFLFGGQ